MTESDDCFRHRPGSVLPEEGFMTKEQEIDLVARAKAGDLQAFEQLYEMHRAAIHRTARLITGDHATAEEILQETFLRAFKHIDKFHEGVSMAPWLYRVAVNLAYDATTSRRRWMTAITYIVDWLVTPVLESPENQVEEQELQAVVQAAISRLDFKQRAVLVLYYFQEFGLAEIADIMDCPVGTVKSRLYHARENLRRELLADQRLPGGLPHEFTRIFLSR
jgi:RNA polymerase sigma-70 factor (ECF subfamily)